MKWIWKNEEELLHYIMTFTGGFMGLYAICAYGNYGSAQTGNLMSMIVDFAGGNAFDFAVRAGGFVLFCAGIAASWLLKRFFTLPMRELCLLVDAAALAVSAFLPRQLYPFFHLYPLFVATSFQWGTFDGVGSYKSASLFLTGNLKNCVTSCLEYLVERKAEKRMGARIYSLAIGSYLLGGYAGCVAVKARGFGGAFYGYLPLLLAGLLLAGEHIGERRGRAVASNANNF